MDEKKTIILMNKGKRPWTLVDAEKNKKVVDSMGTIELDETQALRLLLDYPRDFIKASEAGPSSRDIARMEQSIRDRTANLDKREKDLDEREAAIKAREDALEPPAETRDTLAPPADGAGEAKKRGRPAKAE